MPRLGPTPPFGKALFLSDIGLLEGLCGIRVCGWTGKHKFLRSPSVHLSYNYTHVQAVHSPVTYMLIA